MNLSPENALAGRARRSCGSQTPPLWNEASGPYWCGRVMDLKRVLGFSLSPVRMDPDGASTPPEVSALAPPSQPAAGQAAAPAGAATSAPARLFEATRIEGLTAPTAEPARVAAPPRPAQAPVPLAAHAPPALPALTALSASVSDSGTRDVLANVLPAAAPTPEPALKHPRFGASGLAAVSRPAQALILLALFSTSLGFAAAALWPQRSRPPTPVHPGAAEPVGASDLAHAPPSESHLPGWQSHDQIVSGPCARQREPRRLAAGISASVPLEALALRGSVDVLIGVGSSAGTALGLELDTTTLEAHEAWREPGTSELLGVLPRAHAEPASFVSDRTGVSGYRELRTLPGESGLALARTRRSRCFWFRCGADTSSGPLPWAAADPLSDLALEISPRGLRR
jgi:hypothetical protein